MDGFKTVFNTFDKNKSGHVSIADLKTIFESLGRDSNEFKSIITELELSHLRDNDRITFDQFVMVMQMLEKEMDKGELYPSDQNVRHSNSNNIESDNNGKDSYNLDLKNDFSDSASKNLFVPTNENDREPEPPNYEVVDDSSESNAGGKANENIDDGYQAEDKDLNHQTSEDPIPESDSKDEDDYQSESSSNFQLPKSPTTKERKIYGAMLPKRGVYFLPDIKVVDFIRILNKHKRMCIKVGKLAEAKKAKTKIDELRSKELLRQLTNMCISHEKELDTVK